MDNDSQAARTFGEDLGARGFIEDFLVKGAGWVDMESGIDNLASSLGERARDRSGL